MLPDKLLITRVLINRHQLIREVEGACVHVGSNYPLDLRDSQKLLAALKGI